MASTLKSDPDLLSVGSRQWPVGKKQGSRSPKPRPVPHRSLSIERGVGIFGIGSRVPDRVLTNADLEKLVETSDEWIVTRTGISERRIVAEGEATSDLATAAALRALDHAGVSPMDVDLVIVATITPDMPFPAVSNLVQDRIGARRAAT